MRVVPSLVVEFEELCAEYSAVDQQGRDIVALVKAFGEQFDHILFEDELDFAGTWGKFLEEHKHQVNAMPMVGLILYVLVTYWDMGPAFFQELPTLERIAVRDTVQEISDEINRRSAIGGDVVIGG